jgi:hypothetical protein
VLLSNSSEKDVLPNPSCGGAISDFSLFEGSDSGAEGVLSGFAPIRFAAASNHGHGNRDNGLPSGPPRRSFVSASPCAPLESIESGLPCLSRNEEADHRMMPACVSFGSALAMVFPEPVLLDTQRRAKGYMGLKSVSRLLTQGPRSYISPCVTVCLRKRGSGYFSSEVRLPYARPGRRRYSHHLPTSVIAERHLF